METTKTIPSKWEVDSPKKCYTKCEHISELDKHQIVIARPVWHVIRAMLKKFPKDEWQMMLTGQLHGEIAHVTGYYVTKQKVTSCHVTNLDVVDKAMIEAKGIIAGIHSHVNMGVTPSGTDINDSVMSLIDYHIIINNKHETNGMRKATLPCGGMCVVECDVQLVSEVDLDAVVIEGVENVTVQTYASTTNYSPATGVQFWSKKTQRFVTRAEHELEESEALQEDKTKTFWNNIKSKDKTQAERDAEDDADTIRMMQEHGHYGY